MLYYIKNKIYNISPVDLLVRLYYTIIEKEYFILTYTIHNSKNCDINRTMVLILNGNSEKNRLFDLFKAFVQIDSSHKSDFFFLTKKLFSLHLRNVF